MSEPPADPTPGDLAALLASAGGALSMQFATQPGMTGKVMVALHLGTPVMSVAAVFDPDMGERVILAFADGMRKAVRAAHKANSPLVQPGTPGFQLPGKR